MRRNTIGLTAAALVAAGVVGVSGAAIAAAADDTAATPTTSTTSPTAPPGGGSARAGGSQDTAVTGSEADKVIAAVKAKDSSATITTVRKDPDGSYDALGTKGGSPVFFEVSADLKTVTARTGGPGGHGAPDGSTGSLPGGSSTGTTSSDPTDANTGSAI